MNYQDARKRLKRIICDQITDFQAEIMLDIAESLHRIAEQGAATPLPSTEQLSQLVSKSVSFDPDLEE